MAEFDSIKKTNWSDLLQEERDAFLTSFLSTDESALSKTAESWNIETDLFVTRARNKLSKLNVCCRTGNFKEASVHNLVSWVILLAFAGTPNKRELVTKKLLSGSVEVAFFFDKAGSCIFYIMPMDERVLEAILRAALDDESIMSLFKGVAKWCKSASTEFSLDID